MKKYIFTVDLDEDFIADTLVLSGTLKTKLKKYKIVGIFDATTAVLLKEEKTLLDVSGKPTV